MSHNFQGLYEYLVRYQTEFSSWLLTGHIISINFIILLFFENKKDDSNVGTIVNHGVASFFRVGQSLHVIPTHASQESEGPRRLLAPFTSEQQKRA